MHPLTEKKQIRAEYLEEARRIINKAEKENRGLTKKEKSKSDKLFEKVDTLADEIREMEEQMEKDKQALMRELESKDRKGNPKIYRRSDLDKYAKNVKQRSAFDSKDISAGSCIRSLITGEWNSKEEKRVMNTITDSAGGYIVPDSIAASVVRQALDETVVLKSGGAVFDMQEKNVTVPKITDSPAGEFKVENESFNFGDLTFSGIDLEAKTLIAGIKMSMELAEDGNDIERHIENSLAESLALALDKAALKGDGTGANPTGILHTTGIQTIDSATDLIDLTDYDVISEAVQKVEEENGTPGAVIYNPTIKGNFDRLTDNSNQPLTPLPSYQNLNKFVTNSLDNDEIFVGDFSQLLWGIRSGLRIEISRVAEDSFSKGQVLVRAYLRGDVALARPNNFVVIGETE